MFTVSTTAIVIDTNTVTDFDAVYAFTNCLNNAARFMTGNMVATFLDQIGTETIDVQVAPTDAGCLHTNKGFSKARLRIGKVLDGRSSIS